jgi:uncharacterized membrane protein
MKIFKFITALFLVIVLSYPAIKPLLSPGLYFPMHDDTQPARIYEMAKELAAGQFPVRWVPDLGYGYGYPLFNFYAPLPYYIGAGFNLLGVSAIDSSKIMFIIGILLSGSMMFLLGNRIAGFAAGILSAVLFMYAPYHGVNLYVRGAVGELYAYGFLPLVFLGLYNLLSGFRIKKNENDKIKNGIIAGSMGLAGVLLSHNVLGLITVYILSGILICALFLTVFKKLKPGIIYSILGILLLGIGLSAFFILPAYAEKNYTRVGNLIQGGSDYRQNFVFADQLWNSPWGYGGSGPGRNDGMSFMIGKAHMILGLFSVMILLYFLVKREYFKKVKFLILIFTVFAGSIFMMLPGSLFIWQLLPLFTFIQYPWRFLNFTLLALTILIIYPFVIPTHRVIKYSISVIIISGIIMFNIKYFQPHFLKPAVENDYLSRDNLQYYISKISDEYLTADFVNPTSAETIVNSIISADVSVNNLIERGTLISFSALTSVQSSVTLNLAYFPGWQATIEGVKVPLSSEKGLFTLTIPAGNHTVELQLRDTPVRTLGNTISFFSLILLVYISLPAGKFSLWLKRESK